MKLHPLRAAAALTTAFATLLVPSAASAQTYQLRQRAQGLVVASSGVASLSSQSLSFSGAAGDWTEPRVVSLTNTGQGPLGVSSWAIPQGNGYNGFYISDNTCPEELSPSQTCTVAVYAQIQSGARTASLELSVTNSSSRVLRLQLASSENTPDVEPSVTLSTSAVSFGTVPTHTTVTRQVVATNTGEGVLTWGAAPAVTGDSAFSPGLTSCGSTLAAGSSCQAEVSFTPTTTGSFNGMLSFTSTLTNSPHQVSLEGTAFNPVSLAAATLPAAKLGMAYSYDFKSLLSVSNEVNPDKSQATWSSSGTLPSGLSFNTNTGILSGTPSVLNAGADYTVTGTYKNNQGQQVYTIKVGEAVLEVVQVATGEFHTCAVTTAGGLKCWGRDGKGQLGNDAAFTSKPTPVDVLGLTSGVARVSAGYHHTCAVTTAGGLKCWGWDDSGQLGNDAALTNQPTPVDVLGMTSGVASVSAGMYHTCAVTTAGGLKCWGQGSYGQLGNDAALTNQPTPVNVAGLTSGVASVSGGIFHTCAVTTAGGLKCWGSDYYGQLGDDAAFTSKPTPVDVLGLTSGVASVATGGGYTCALTTAGGLKCWGGDANGQLGNDAALADKPTPVDVLGLTSGVARVSAGASHTCALTTAGGLKCWGWDGKSQLGNDAALADKPTPVDVLGLTSGVASVATGGGHTCAVTTAGGLKCWGQDGNGQLGNDAALTNQPTPVNVSP